jgi:hypothetical protein
VALVLIAAVGCGKRTPELSDVRGTVYYRGEPIRGGTIVFAPDPDRGGAGPLAIAEIQSDGTFRLRTDGERGAVVGWHRVTISPSEEFIALPRRYCDPDLGGLCHEVVKGKANVINLYLD